MTGFRIKRCAHLQRKGCEQGVGGWGGGWDKGLPFRLTPGNCGRSARSVKRHPGNCCGKKKKILPCLITGWEASLLRSPHHHQHFPHPLLYLFLRLCKKLATHIFRGYMFFQETKWWHFLWKKSQFESSCASIPCQTLNFNSSSRNPWAFWCVENTARQLFC